MAMVYIVAAAGCYPLTYGFATGFPVSVATGVSILLDWDPL